VAAGAVGSAEGEAKRDRGIGGAVEGKELARQEVLRIVAEWLGEEEGFVEVV